MKKVKFNQRYGHFNAVIAGKKTQFHQVEKRLINYLTENYPTSKIDRLDMPVSWEECDKIIVHLATPRHLLPSCGASFQYRPAYRIGEILEVVGTRGKVQIRITDIHIERLCNATVKEVLNEGFFKMKIDSYNQYCYNDLETNDVIYFHTHCQAWISQLYRLYDSDLVLSNPYSVVYEFELMHNS